MSRPLPSAGSPLPLPNSTKEPVSGKLPSMMPQNMYPKGYQSPMFPESQNSSSSNKEKFTKHSMKPNVAKITASTSPSLEDAKKLPSKYSVHPSHRFPVAPQKYNNITNTANASEGRKTLRAFTELRQSANALYPSTSKTSVFLKQSSSSEEFAIESSTTPFIHMLMSHNQTEASKMKERNIVSNSVCDKRAVAAKNLPKRELLQQHLSFSEFLRMNDDFSDTASRASTNSESTTNTSPSLSAFSSARSEIEWEKQLSNTSINERIDELTSALKDKNTELALMKNDMKSLRATVEESSKEANLAKKLLQNYSVKISSLEDQIDNLEDRVNKQETEIVEHLISKIDEEVPASSSESLMSVIEEKEIIKPPSPHLSSTINFDKILSSIGDLNRRMDRMQSMQLIYANDKSGATFKQPKPVTLILYKNGIVLGETGFRSYNVDSVKQVLIDLCKGYFPSELFTQHPTGIYINVSDKRGLEYRESETFSGKGCKLSDPKDIQELNAVTVPGTPSCGISQSELSSPCESLESLVSTKSRLELIEVPDLISDNRVTGMKDKIITLKLKQISTDKCFKMRVSISTMIEEIVNHLAKTLALDDKSDQFETRDRTGDDSKAQLKIDLISSAPFGILSNFNASLKEYGIVQNTVLYIK